MKVFRSDDTWDHGRSFDLFHELILAARVAERSPQIGTAATSGRRGLSIDTIPDGPFIQMPCGRSASMDAVSRAAELGSGPQGTQTGVVGVAV